MAKRSQRRPLRYERGQAGCMWGFITIFDFRHGRAPRRLLSDRRRPSREVVGAGDSEPKPLMLTNSNATSQENYDGEEGNTLIADAAKTSVKQLMEEEIFSEQDWKHPISRSETEAKESDSECKGRVKKNRKRTRKNSKSTGDIHFVGPEGTFRQEPEGKSWKNLDMEVVVNELCQQIYQKSPNYMKHDGKNDIDIMSERMYSVFDQKLIEAIKEFVDRRVKDGKHDLIEDRKVDNSKEIVKALQTSCSIKELILELLKDPNSLLVKHIGELEDSQLEKDLFDEKQNNSKPSVPVARKQHNFFRRRSKSQENILLKGEENSPTSNRIVILKPGPPGVRISETGKMLSSPLQSEFGLGNKVQSERIGSQFSFSEIKRKLKHVMGKEGKERSGVPSDDLAKRFPYERQKSGNSEKGGWNSPNRNHFYNERFARPVPGIKNKDKSCKQKDTETSKGNETVDYPKPRVSNIYIEAKKHLSEMLSNGDEIEDFSGRQLPKTLGRILSFPDFDFSPSCSPGRDKEYKFVTAQQRLAACNNFHVVNEDTCQLTPENHVSQSSQNLNCQSCVGDDPEDKVQSCNLDSDVLNELNHADTAEVALYSVRPENDSEGDVVIERTADSLVQEESEVLDIPAEQCSSSVIRNESNDQNGDLAEVCDEDESAQCLKSESSEQDELPSSPLTSPPSSSITKHVEDLDSAIERPERPSPVSVLEPLFTEDDISPASIKSQPVEPPMQPRRIHFEEFSSATNQEICVRICMEDEESAFEYVEAVLLGSDLNWEDFLLRWLSSDQILDPSLFDEVELFSSRSCHDQRLLFDCTNEVLTEVCERYFGYSPWVSFVKRNIRSVPRGKDLICEVWEGVEWHILPPTSPPCTLDQIVRKDLSKPGTWMELRIDVESIGIEIEEAIFEELMEDTMLSFVNEDAEIDSSVLPTELTESE